MFLYFQSENPIFGASTFLLRSKSTFPIISQGNIDNKINDHKYPDSLYKECPNAYHRSFITKCLRVLPWSPHRVAVIHALDIDFFIVIGINVMRIVRFIPRRYYRRHRRCRCRRRRSSVPQAFRFGIAICC